MILNFALSLTCFAVAGAIPSPAYAQEQLSPAPIYLREFSKEKPLSTTAQGTSGSRLTLHGFVQVIDANYPKLLSADAERRLIIAKVLEKAGAFDPLLTHVSEYLRVQDIFTPGEAKNAIHNESRVDLLTRSGMRVFAGMRLNPNDTKTPFVPTGSSGEYYGGVSMPLLRGRGVNEKTIAETQVKLSQPLAQQVYLAARMEVLLKAGGIYWEWVGAKSRLLVANNLLAIAEQRVSQIKERVKSGDAPALEATEAEQEIERRRAGLVKAQRDLQKTSIQMSVYLWRNDITPDTVPQVEAIPDLSPLPAKVSDKTWLESDKLAILQRPELKRIAAERKIAIAELRLAENQLLPVMDAYALQGADTGKNGIGPVVRGGVNFSIPLRQRTARGLIMAAKTKLQKLNFDEIAERQRIRAEVEDVVSAINTSFEKFIALTAEVNKAKAVESGEKLRFAAGDSTLFLVNQRERSTAEAQVRLIDVHVEYLQALTAFDIVTCKL